MENLIDKDEMLFKASSRVSNLYAQLDYANAKVDVAECRAKRAELESWEAINGCRREVGSLRDAVANKDREIESLKAELANKQREFEVSLVNAAIHHGLACEVKVSGALLDDRWVTVGGYIEDPITHGKDVVDTLCLHVETLMKQKFDLKGREIESLKKQLEAAYTEPPALPCTLHALALHLGISNRKARSLFNDGTFTCDRVAIDIDRCRHEYVESLRAMLDNRDSDVAVLKAEVAHYAKRAEHANERNERQAYAYDDLRVKLDSLQAELADKETAWALEEDRYLSESNDLANEKARLRLRIQKLERLVSIVVRTLKGEDLLDMEDFCIGDLLLFREYGLIADDPEDDVPESLREGAAASGERIWL